MPVRLRPAIEYPHHQLARDDGLSSHANRLQTPAERVHSASKRAETRLQRLESRP